MNDSLGGMLIGGLLGNPILAISWYGFNITFIDITPTPTPTPTSTPTNTPSVSQTLPIPTPTATPTLSATPIVTPTAIIPPKVGHHSGSRDQYEEIDSYVSINITINKLNFKKTYKVTKKRANILIKSISKMKKIKSDINILLSKYKGK